MYEREIIQVNAESNCIEAVWQDAKKLSIEEKAELVERLLGKDSGLMVVSKSSHLADYIIAQTNLLSLDGLAYVLKAIAVRIADESKSSKR